MLPLHRFLLLVIVVGLGGCDIVGGDETTPVPIDGTWEASVETDTEAYEITLEVTEQGGAVEGEADVYEVGSGTSYGPGVVGSYVPPDITLTVEFADGSAWLFEGVVRADPARLTGPLDLGDGPAPAVTFRRPEASSDE